MDEYAAGRTFMTHDEFMTLAEIILQEYEFMQRFALVRRDAFCPRVPF